MLFLLFLSLLSPLAQAGDRIGNGGDVLICPGERPEILDLYAARKQLKLNIDFGPGEIHEEILQYILARLKQVSPERASNFQRDLQNFSAESEFLSGIELVDIPDTGAQVIPRGCHLEQIAVQRSEVERLPGDKRYTINKDLWDQLDERNKAALILHELAYKEALAQATANSLFVRYLVAHYLSREILTVDQQELLLNARAEFYELEGDFVQVNYSNRNDRFLYSRSEKPVVAVKGVTSNFPAIVGAKCERVNQRFEEIPGTEFLNLSRCADKSITYRFRDFQGNILTADINLGGWTELWSYPKKPAGRLREGILGADMQFPNGKVCAKGMKLFYFRPGGQPTLSCQETSDRGFQYEVETDL